MMLLKILMAGVIAGLFANVTGYLVTGRLFHRLQAKTPGTWRASESWKHYQYAALVRVGGCIGIVLAYTVLKSAVSVFGGGPVVQGALFGSLLWSATILPMVVEASLFVNWHPGFVAGLLLDWLLVCVLAGIAAAMAVSSI